MQHIQNKVVIANVVYLLYSYNVTNIFSILLTDMLAFKTPRLV